ncbi:MAG: NADH-quinone oxidoreductase subunit C [Armatimonadetes bacterium]|nr:NADH-quinone oxidoreductase subunit C [Armatimonadota bacterium]
MEPFPRPEESHAEGHGPAAPARGHGETKFTHHVPGAWVPAASLLEVCRVVRDEAPFHLDYCSFVSAVDWMADGTFEVVYHLYSMTERHQMLLKVRVPRQSPRTPSVTGIWGGTNWHERETYDLFGIVFEGHPDLRRIMMTEDWHGHPLRKDYVYEEPRWLVDLATQRQREIEGLGLGERA